MPLVTFGELLNISRQAGLVCLPPLDAILPCGTCRINGLYNPSSNYNYITASVVYDLYDTAILQVRNTHKKLDLNKRKG
uniref:Uncharacterized protein n=1 Tax=Arundo donax TaxID=35708 RepID=A0A0A8ZH32_ARUDO